MRFLEEHAQHRYICIDLPMCLSLDSSHIIIKVESTIILVNIQATAPSLNSTNAIEFGPNDQKSPKVITVALNLVILSLKLSHL